MLRGKFGFERMQMVMRPFLRSHITPAGLPVQDYKVLLVQHGELLAVIWQVDGEVVSRKIETHGEA